MDLQNQKGIIIATVNCIVYRPYKSSNTNSDGNDDDDSNGGSSRSDCVYTHLHRKLLGIRESSGKYIVLLLCWEYCCFCCCCYCWWCYISVRAYVRKSLAAVVAVVCSRRPLHFSLGLLATKKIRKHIHGDQRTGKFNKKKMSNEREWECEWVNEQNIAWA